MAEAREVAAVAAEEEGEEEEGESGGPGAVVKERKEPRFVEGERTMEAARENMPRVRG